jgi:hypothetical protein
MNLDGPGSADGRGRGVPGELFLDGVPVEAAMVHRRRVTVGELAV